VAAGSTRRGELRRAAEKLAQASAPVVGAVLNKATAQDGYGYYGGYQPYVPPRDWSPEDARTTHNGHGKQNGSSLASGQPGRHGR
jgi:Mrp family chromosome partitioning ATPase